MDFNRFEKKQLTDGSPVELRFVKFQSVQTLSVRTPIYYESYLNYIQIFFANNQSDSDQTIIKSVTFYGTPIATTNMKDFKKVNLVKIQDLISFFFSSEYRRKVCQWATLNMCQQISIQIFSF